MEDWQKWIGYGCLFGVSWLCGTLIGWGIVQDVFWTFVGIGAVPFIVGVGTAYANLFVHPGNH
jgi:hypothetical protein